MADATLPGAADSGVAAAPAAAAAPAPAAAAPAAEAAHACVQEGDFIVLQVNGQDYAMCDARRGGCVAIARAAAPHARAAPHPPQPLQPPQPRSRGLPPASRGAAA